jgi:hypothetical protein
MSLVDAIGREPLRQVLARSSRDIPSPVKRKVLEWSSEADIKHYCHRLLADINTAIGNQCFFLEEVPMGGLCPDMMLIRRHDGVHVGAFEVKKPHLTVDRTMIPLSAAAMSSQVCAACSLSLCLCSFSLSLCLLLL